MEYCNCGVDKCKKVINNHDVPEAAEEGGEASRGRISTNILDGTSMLPTT